VGHAALTDRLLDADPAWNWEPLAFTPEGLPAFDKAGGLWIKLTVCNQTRLGYGHAASKPNQDPGAREKEVIGDALRNAAMRFGAALDLWHKGDLHAADEDDAAKADPSTDRRPRDEPQGMPDAEWATLVNLVKATQTPVDTLRQRYGVQSLKVLNQEQYGDAIKYLNDVLAEKAKAETNRAAQNADLADDEIPY
jgi:hypothetical protein